MHLLTCRPNHFSLTKILLGIYCNPRFTSPSLCRSLLTLFILGWCCWEPALPGWQWGGPTSCPVVAGYPVADCSHPSRFLHYCPLLFLLFLPCASDMPLRDQCSLDCKHQCATCPPRGRFMMVQHRDAPGATLPATSSRSRTSPLAYCSLALPVAVNAFDEILARPCRRGISPHVSSLLWAA
jgi:hypothetical protein